MGDLYQSGWNTRGVRKDFERTSMETITTGKFLSQIVPANYGDPEEAVAWFADNGDGDLKILVADYPNGKRVTLRMLANNCRRISFAPRPQ